MYRNLISLTAPEHTHPRPAKLVMLEVRRQARRELLRRRPTHFALEYVWKGDTFESHSSGPYGTIGPTEAGLIALAKLVLKSGFDLAVDH